MDTLSNQGMLEREQAVFKTGLTADALMEAAGAAMAQRVQEIYPAARDYMIMVGKGNNGGDGLVMARYLAKAAKCVEVVLTAPEESLGELPVANLKRLRLEHTTGVEILPWSDEIVFPYSNGVLIDALLGVQAKGKLRDPLAGIVAALNEARARCFFRTVALDLPSGLAGYEEGAAPSDLNDAIIADITLAVGYAKNVLVREACAPWVGRLEVIPWTSKMETGGARQVLVPHELAGLLPRRSALSYKGNFGKLAIIAGSPGFTGAAILCAQAAQGMGAGLLSVCTHADAAPIIAAHAPPEAMVSGWDDLDEVPKVVAQADAIVIGPGLGATPDTEKMLRAALSVGCPVLIDADGLNILAKNLDLLRETKGRVVLTPHVGEMARLLGGRKFSHDDRESIARDFADKHPNVTLLLKGTRTLITAQGGPFYINTTGNPGLSTGGSGDTLSGMIGALLGAKLKPIDAARLAIWLHGHAIDLALLDRGAEEGLTPTMLSAHLGKALASLRYQAAPRPGLIETAQRA